ncbi:MepB family protein [Streptomyces sp. NPDC048636]|uniref:MepB family protein n=1 Tax=Streptomyces sp. NPDC048636 TaxID=3155762 RepID=UPI0034249E19
MGTEAAWRGPVHSDLQAAKALVYDACGFRCTEPVPEEESAEYAACAFSVDGLALRFRVAKTTPTKTGQFVTVWQRSERGPIRPFDVADAVDLFVISSHEGDRFGQFVFSCEALRARGIVSADGAGGKRGFRVYPPWAATTSRQARATQAWQLESFLDIPVAGPLDTARAKALYQPRR